MNNQKPAQTKQFDTIELLVHPFYALENLARHRSAAGLKSATYEEVLEDYAILGLEKAWRNRLALAAKKPNTIMILVGLKTRGGLLDIMFSKLEYFFEGKLTRKKLEKFSTTYQSFLRDAKKALGRRLIYISDNLQFKAWHIDSLLKARGLYPAKEVKVRAYGEFLDKKGKQCVEFRLEELKQLIPLLQRNTQVKTRRLKRKGNALLSLASHDELPAADTARLVRRRVKITPQIVSQRMQIRNARKYAKGINTLLKAKNVRRGI